MLVCSSKGVSSVARFQFTPSAELQISPRGPISELFPPTTQRRLLKTAIPAFDLGMNPALPVACAQLALTSGVGVKVGVKVGAPWVLEYQTSDKLSRDCPTPVSNESLSEIPPNTQKWPFAVTAAPKIREVNGAL